MNGRRFGRWCFRLSVLVALICMVMCVVSRRWDLWALGVGGGIAGMVGFALDALQRVAHQGVDKQGE